MLQFTSSFPFLQCPVPSAVVLVVVKVAPVTEVVALALAVNTTARAAAKRYNAYRRPRGCFVRAPMPSLSVDIFPLSCAAASR
jgi:hypothetical protein